MVTVMDHRCAANFGAPPRDWVPSRCGEWTTCCGDAYGTMMCGWCGHFSVYKIARRSKSKGVFLCCLSVCRFPHGPVLFVLLICPSLLFQMDDKDSVKESFLARLQDEHLAVVKALLKDPQVTSAVLGSFFSFSSELVSGVQFGEKWFWFVCWYFDSAVPFSLFWVYLLIFWFGHSFFKSHDLQVPFGA